MTCEEETRVALSTTREDKSPREKTQSPRQKRSRPAVLPPEISATQTLKEYLAAELPGANIVYERLCRGSCPVAERKSLFFTELFSIPYGRSYRHSESLNDPQAQGGCVMLEKDMVPYYRVKGQTDGTLVFESRFESGNLRLAIKVRTTKRKGRLQSRREKPNMICTCRTT